MPPPLFMTMYFYTSQFFFSFNYITKYCGTQFINEYIVTIRPEGYVYVMATVGYGYNSPDHCSPYERGSISPAGMGLGPIRVANQHGLSADTIL